MELSDEELEERAEVAYDVWMSGPAGPAFAGDEDVRIGFIDGYKLGKLGCL